MNKFAKVTAAVVIGLSALTGLASLENVSSGEYVRYQKANGDYEWFTSPGIKFVQPFVSTLTEYTETITVAFSDSEETRDSASVSELPATVKFADGYTGSGNFTMRFKLSPDPVKLEEMHIAVKNQTALEGNTLLVAADELLNQTANQFTGSGYAQGGKGEFKSRLVDQAKYGMLAVKRVRKEVDSIVADATVEGKRKQNSTAKAYEYVMEVQLDANGMPIRTPLDISQYGIRISQITMGDFDESNELEAFLSDRRQKERDRKNRIDMQNVEREEAITTGLRGETARIAAQNEANKRKDAAIIQAEQTKELAEIQAEREVIEREKVAALAIINKNTELQQAEADEGIQKAKAAAAKYKATAIKQVGFAEAAVKKADYQAIDKEVLALEVDKAKSLALYSTRMSVTMPTIVGGGNGETNSLETFTSLGVLKQLGKQAK